jgi:DNA-directed RNA polymerase subunit RPC12/RpoP
MGVNATNKETGVNARCSKCGHDIFTQLCYIPAYAGFTIFGLRVMSPSTERLTADCKACGYRMAFQPGTISTRKSM